MKLMQMTTHAAHEIFPIMKYAINLKQMNENDLINPDLSSMLLSCCGFYHGYLQ